MEIKIVKSSNKLNFQVARKTSLQFMLSKLLVLLLKLYIVTFPRQPKSAFWSKFVSTLSEVNCDSDFHLQNHHLLYLCRKFENQYLVPVWCAMPVNTICHSDGVLIFHHKRHIMALYLHWSSIATHVRVPVQKNYEIIAQMEGWFYHKKLKLIL